MTNKNRPSYIAGSIFAWCFIFIMFAALFYGAIILQKQILGVTDIEQRLERIESKMMEQNNDE